MKRTLLLLPLLLAACAPTLQNVPTPEAGEVIVQVEPSSKSYGLTAEEQSGAAGFATIAALMILVNKSPINGYQPFRLPQDEKSIETLSAKGKPLHMRITWQADQIEGNSSHILVWESRPIDGNLLSVKLHAISTDPDRSAHFLEAVFIDAFLKMPSVKLWARGPYQH